jgi:hypothetical protein
VEAKRPTAAGAAPPRRREPMRRTRATRHAPAARSGDLPEGPRTRRVGVTARAAAPADATTDAWRSPSPTPRAACQALADATPEPARVEPRNSPVATQRGVPPGWSQAAARQKSRARPRTPEGSPQAGSRSRRDHRPRAARWSRKRALHRWIAARTRATCPGRGGSTRATRPPRPPRWSPAARPRPNPDPRGSGRPRADRAGSNP